MDLSAFDALFVLNVALITALLNSSASQAVLVCLYGATDVRDTAEFNPKSLLPPPLFICCFGCVIFYIEISLRQEPVLLYCRHTGLSPVKVYNPTEINGHDYQESIDNHQEAQYNSCRLPS